MPGLRDKVHTARATAVLNQATGVHNFVGLGHYVPAPSGDVDEPPDLRILFSFRRRA